MREYEIIVNGELCTGTLENSDDCSETLISLEDGRQYKLDARAIVRMIDGGTVSTLGDDLQLADYI